MFGPPLRSELSEVGLSEGRADKLTELNRTLDTKNATLHASNTELHQLRTELFQLQTALNQQKTELNQLRTTLDNRNTKFIELQSTLAFLRLKFDTEQADGIPKPDVVIYFQDEKDKPLYAHKIVLANRSVVFNQMFGTETLECKTGTVRIDDATLPVISAVIRFCYHAEIDFTEEVTAADVLPVAHKYAIRILQDICEKYLSQTIDKVTLPKILALAKKFEAKDSKRKH